MSTANQTNRTYVALTDRQSPILSHSSKTDTIEAFKKEFHISGSSNSPALYSNILNPPKLDKLLWLAKLRQCQGEIV